MVLPQVGGCPVYNFKPRISYGNGVLAAAQYGLQVPVGLTATNLPAPTFVDINKMNSLLKGEPGGHGSNLTLVHGLTVTEVTVAFPNPAQQWLPIHKGAALPSWQFKGGDVFIDAKIDVYVLDFDGPQPGDDRTRKIFAIIMEHELLHVLDETDIVTTWMPQEAYKDDKVVRYLTNAEPVDNSMYEYWFKGGHFSKYLVDGIWAPEHDKRRQLRDTTHEYATQGDRIGTLRADMTNHPAKPVPVHP